LENYHASSALEVMKDPNCDFFKEMRPEYRRKTRDIIIRAVLATDMAKHYQSVETLKRRVPLLDYKPSTNAKDKELTLNLFFHMADISNSTKPWELCQTWTERLYNEFFNQGDVEKALGIP
jgi:hypothetical protein